NTAIFTLVDIASLPLPVKDPDQVVQVDFIPNTSDNDSSFPTYVHLRDHTQVFSGLTASTVVELALGKQDVSEEPQQVIGEFVSDNFFSVLGSAQLQCCESAGRTGFSIPSAFLFTAFKISRLITPLKPPMKNQ